MSATRPAGRPGPEPDRGRDAILVAAGRVFDEKGYGGARVDEIAARAGVNKAMLYYHVGGKEELYAAVVARVLDGVLERLSAVLSARTEPRERFRALVEAVGRAARGVP